MSNVEMMYHELENAYVQVAGELMVKLPPDVRDRAARAAHDAFIDVALGPDAHVSDREFKVSIAGWRAVVNAVAQALAENLIVLSKADAEWLCGVIHGEPDVGPNDCTRYDRAHKLLEGDRDGRPASP